jgi:predicted DNA-binding transcriptional regulator AlpA
MHLAPYVPVSRGSAAQEDEPSRVVVVEPIAVREDVAAQLVGLDGETLRYWRKQRKGPPYRKLGSAVVYEVAELRAWVQEQPLVLAV